MKNSQLNIEETHLQLICKIKKGRVCLFFFALLFSSAYGQVNFAPCGSPPAEASSHAIYALCEIYGTVQFDLEIGLGSNSGIENSTQLASALLNIPNPKLKVIGNFSVIDALTLNGAIIEIMPGISINIEEGQSQIGSLILDNCKLFSCDGLWKGINLLVHGSTLKTLNQTHIEDAENAILSRNTQLTTPGQTH